MLAGWYAVIVLNDAENRGGEQTFLAYKIVVAFLLLLKKAEYGNPETDDWEFLQKYSPYHSKSGLRSSGVAPSKSVRLLKPLYLAYHDNRH